MNKVLIGILITLCCGVVTAGTQQKSVLAPNFIFKRYDSKCEVRHLLKPYILSHNKAYRDSARNEVQKFLNKLVGIIVDSNSNLLQGKFKKSDFCIDVYDDWFNAVSMISATHYGQIHYGARLFLSASKVEEIALVLGHELAHFTMAHTNTLDVKNPLVIHRDIYKDNMLLEKIKKLEDLRLEHNIYSNDFFTSGRNTILLDEVAELQEASLQLYGVSGEAVLELEADEIGYQLYLNAGFPPFKDLLLHTERDDPDCMNTLHANEVSNGYLNTCARNEALNRFVESEFIRFNDNKQIDLELLQSEFMKIKQEYIESEALGR